MALARLWSIFPCLSGVICVLMESLSVLCVQYLIPCWLRGPAQGPLCGDAATEQSTGVGQTLGNFKCFFLTTGLFSHIFQILNCYLKIRFFFKVELGNVPSNQSFRERLSVGSLLPAGSWTCHFAGQVAVGINFARGLTEDSFWIIHPFFVSSGVCYFVLVCCFVWIPSIVGNLCSIGCKNDGSEDQINFPVINKEA